MGSVLHLSSVTANPNQIDIAQHAQVFRNRGLFESELVDDIAYGPFLFGQKFDDFATADFSDGIENIGGGGGVKKSLYQA